MKVNSVGQSEAITNYVKTGVKSVSKTETVEIKDSVELSDDAVKFSEMLQNIGAELDDRTSEEQERIKSVTAQIENGTYSIDGSKVASKMLESALNVNI